MFHCEIDNGCILIPLIDESLVDAVSALCVADGMTGMGWLCESLDPHYLIRQTRQLWAMAQGIRVLIKQETRTVGMAEVVISSGLTIPGYYSAQSAVAVVAVRALLDYALSVMNIQQIVLHCPAASTDCHDFATSLGLHDQHITRRETRYGVPVEQWQRGATPIFKHPLNTRAYLHLLHVNDADELRQLIDSNRAYLGYWLPDMGMIDTHEDVLEYIGRGLVNLADGQGFQCGIWHDGALAGVIAYNFIDRMASYTELGYWLVEDQQGNGLMTMAVHTLTGYAFDELGLKCVGLRIATANRRSRALAERLGFVEDAALRHALWLYDQQSDQVLYTMRSHDWWQKQQKVSGDGLSSEGRS